MFCPVDVIRGHIINVRDFKYVLFGIHYLKVFVYSVKIAGNIFTYPSSRMQFMLKS
jgi:hypothetical protein